MVETQKDGTVTTTETTKNGVKIKTVDEPGEDVTAEITVPKSVGEAVVIILPTWTAALWPWTRTPARW